MNTGNMNNVPVNQSVVNSVGSSSNSKSSFQTLTEVSNRAMLKRSQAPLKCKAKAKPKLGPNPYTSTFFDNLSTRSEQSHMMVQSEVVKRYMAKAKGNKKNQKTDCFLRDVPPNPKRKRK